MNEGISTMAKRELLATIRDRYRPPLAIPGLSLTVSDTPRFIPE